MIEQRSGTVVTPLVIVTRPDTLRLIEVRLEMNSAMIPIIVMLAIVLVMGMAGHIGVAQSARVDVLSLYWHFVDVVWVVVFTVVYVIGR